MNQISSIKTWSVDDRPREKLIEKGAQSLSNAELLAILLGSGSRDESAVDLAKRILNYAQNMFDYYQSLYFLNSFFLFWNESFLKL